MKKAIKTLNRLQDIFTAALVAAFIIIILFATICRYFAISTLKWPDELARYLMMWMVFIGCGAAARNGSHFSIDIIYLITGGGPAGSTETVPVYAYNMGWGTKLLGQSSAVTVLLFIFMMVICIGYFAVIGRWEKEDK